MLHNKHHILNLCYPRLFFSPEYDQLYATFYLDGNTLAVVLYMPVGFFIVLNVMTSHLCFRSESYTNTHPPQTHCFDSKHWFCLTQGASGDLGISVIWLKYQIVPTRSRTHANIPHADRHISCMIIDLTILKSSPNLSFRSFTQQCSLCQFTVSPDLCQISGMCTTSIPVQWRIAKYVVALDSKDCDRWNVSGPSIHSLSERKIML